MGFVDGKTTKAFRTCHNKGFHITLPNGWTISVQFGSGNYGDNYDMVFDSDIPIEDKWSGKKDIEADTVEIWCWNKDSKKHYPEDPLAYQTMEDFLKIIEKVSKMKP